MGISKHITTGNLNLEFSVAESAGLLDPNTAVQMQVGPPYTVESLGVTPSLGIPIGLVVVPNKKIGGRCTVSTIGRALEHGKLIGGISFVLPGSPVQKAPDGRITYAGLNCGSTSMSVQDHVWGGGEKITFATHYVITEGIEFVAGGTKEETAQSIAKAINLFIPDIHAKVQSNVVMIEAYHAWAGEITIETDADPSDLWIVGNVPRGNFNAYWPYGIALTMASIENDPIDVLVL